MIGSITCSRCVRRCREAVGKDHVAVVTCGHCGCNDAISLFDFAVEVYSECGCSGRAAASCCRGVTLRRGEKEYFGGRWWFCSCRRFLLSLRDVIAHGFLVQRCSCRLVSSGCTYRDSIVLCDVRGALLLLSASALLWCRFGPSNGHMLPLGLSGD